MSEAEHARDPAAEVDPDPRLDYPIDCLRPTPRGLHACARLGVHTVGDFFKRDKSEFLALPNCGSRTYRDLETRARRFLSEARSRPPPSRTDLERPLDQIVTDQRALRAFRRLGIQTVGDFVAAPRDELLAVEGFGDRTYWKVLEQVRAAAETAPFVDLLPDGLLAVSLADLDMQETLISEFAAAGAHRVRDLMALPFHHPCLSRTNCGIVRLALERLLLVGLRKTGKSTAPETPTFPAFLAHLQARLSAADYHVFESAVGISGRPQPLWRIASESGRSQESLPGRIAWLREEIVQIAPEFTGALRATAEREMLAFEGIVTSDHIATGSVLHAAGRNDDQLPFRLLAFLFPDEFTHHEEYLTTLPLGVLVEVKERLRRLTRPELLPVGIRDLEKAMSDLPSPVGRGFLLHVLQRDLRLSIDIHAEHGEVAAARRASVVQRAQAILEDHGGPMPLDDLMFSYRDRHRTVRRSRLLDQLRSDNRFVEVDREVWSLRELHLDELEIHRPQSEILRDRILKSGESYTVTEFSVEGGMSARSLHLVIALLRRDPNLRDLGRGRFCPRFKNHSTIVEELIRDLRRAMGELPFSRFLQNQSESRRRLVSAILRSNRLFVSPAPDRVDLLENYPFGENRMYRLVRVADDCLEIGSGYTSVTSIKAAVNEVGLGGEFLNDYLLEDLLRRNAGYEILPGGIVALQSLGLSSWIQQRVREAIRNAGCALTPQQVLVEEPELAEFGDTLPRLIETDPHVHSLDGLHFEVV